MARGKKRRGKQKRGGRSQYTQRSIARNKRRASVAESTGQRAFAFRGSADVGEGRKNKKSSGNGGGRKTGGGTGGGSTDMLLYGGLALGAFLLLSKQ